MFSDERIAQLNENRLSDPELNPELVAKVKRLISLAKTRGYSLVVTQGYRSVAEQNRLYAQGRTRPGKIVTNARGGQSNHNKGTAVDVAFVVGGEISWNDQLYAKLGPWAAAVGLKWGGNWKHFKDKPHLEI